MPGGLKPKKKTNTSISQPKADKNKPNKKPQSKKVYK